MYGPFKDDKKCCLQAIQFIRGKNNSPSMSSIAHSSHMDIFQVTLLLQYRRCRILQVEGGPEMEFLNGIFGLGFWA
jgi:hypothetical protein